jgi:sugar/nucleoside kinase (ribokinase family)
MTTDGCVTAKKVMVAGHICLDITPIFSSRKVNSITEVLSPGKLINVGEAEISAGGAVANTGLGMKILGAKVKLAGKVGDDQFGRIIKRIFDEYGCADDLLVDSESSTSYSIVLAIPGIDRIFLHNPGANDTFCTGDITGDMLEDIRHFHLGYPPLMRQLFLDKGAELKKLLAMMKSNGITTSLDMAAIDPASEAGQQDWETILCNVMPLIDFFVPSIEELGYMMDKNLHKEWLKRAAGNDITRLLSVDQDVRPLADRLLGMGAKVLLIKCGVSGMYYRTASGAIMNELCEAQQLNSEVWNGKEGFEESYLQEHVVSGKGAGDTSIAAFLTSMLNGKSLEQCVRLAAATGACCISSHDALSGLLPLEVLQVKIDRGWEKEKINSRSICMQ